MTNANKLISMLREEAKMVFMLMLTKGPLSKNSIEDMTKIKLSTLNRIIQPLEDNEFIIECSVGESTGGRKPALFDVNPERYFLIGVDISRTYTHMAVISLKMKILYEREFSMLESCTPEEVVRIISGFVRNSFTKLHLCSEMIIGIGIGTVGPLDRKNGYILKPSNFSAPGWHNVPIKSMVEQATGLPVIIDNGANMAALAEYAFGDGKLFKNIAYINCGMGIRTGTISSGTIVRTIDDAEDAFGHMVVDIDGEACSCGSYGCVECYSSIPAIVKRFTAEIKKGRTTIVEGGPENLNYVDICTAAENGDELAREILTGAGTVFGVGLANYINLIGPQVVILSGPLIRHSGLFFETCSSVALKKSYLKGENRIRFCRGGSFSDNAITIGAGVSVLYDVLSERNDGGDRYANSFRKAN